jgi:hypothetical protein
VELHARSRATPAEGKQRHASKQSAPQGSG